jgi:hypothetical protein
VGRTALTFRSSPDQSGSSWSGVLRLYVDWPVTRDGELRRRHPASSSNFEPAQVSSPTANTAAACTSHTVATGGRWTVPTMPYTFFGGRSLKRLGDRTSRPDRLFRVPSCFLDGWRSVRPLTGGPFSRARKLLVATVWRRKVNTPGLGCRVHSLADSSATRSSCAR